MNLAKLIAALSVLGLAVAITSQSPAYAGTTKSPSAKHKMTSSVGRSRAQPGDTCLGIPACNTLIVECVTSGLDFKPIQHGPEGQPSYGQCVKRTD
jgi:hypothetical protein